MHRLECPLTGMVSESSKTMTHCELRRSNSATLLPNRSRSDGITGIDRPTFKPLHTRSDYFTCGGESSLTIGWLAINLRRAYI